jgi:GH15 family glucan-1,4-alpha-glucosidase
MSSDSPQRGGHFSLFGRTRARPKQFYLPDTNILLTRFLAPEAVGEVIDFMVPETSGTAAPRDLLVRQARAVRGRATFELACFPAFDYGRVRHEVEIVEGVGAVFTSAAGRCVLRSSVPLKIHEGSGNGLGVGATFTLEQGEQVDFELEWNGEVRALQSGETERLFTRTSEFWQRWLGQSRYRGRWREMVNRSALGPQTARVSPHRRARRRTDHLTAGGGRSRTRASGRCAAHGSDSPTRR